MVHVSRKTRRGCERFVQAVGGISSLPTRIASWRCGPGEPAWFRAHGSLHMIPKTEGTIFDTHRQIGRLVYTGSPGSNLRFNPTEEAPYGNSGASRLTGTETQESRKRITRSTRTPFNRRPANC